MPEMEPWVRIVLALAVIGLTVLQLDVFIDPEPRSRKMTVTVPDTIAQAFNDAISAKTLADAKAAVKAQTGAALATAQAADDQAAADLTSASMDLNNKRAALDALIDGYLQPGVQPSKPKPITPIAPIAAFK